MRIRSFRELCWSSTHGRSDIRSPPDDGSSDTGVGGEDNAELQAAIKLTLDGLGAPRESAVHQCAAQVMRRGALYNFSPC